MLRSMSCRLTKAVTDGLMLLPKFCDLSGYVDTQRHGPGHISKCDQSASTGPWAGAQQADGLAQRCEHT